MKKRMWTGAMLIISTAGLLLTSAQTSAQSQRVLFNIGTAGITGSFWPTGGQVCNLVNKSRKSQGHKLRCTVESTAGSVSNLRALRNGDLDLALAQSNLQYHSYHASGPFKEEGAHKDLRYVMSFTTNRLHVVTRKDANIKTMQDLKGKRVNTGNPGSGTEATSYMVFSYYGIDPKKDLAVDSKLPSREQSKALCDGKIDAYLYPTAVPVATIEEAANTCEVSFVSLEGPELDKLLAERDYFGKVTIPAGSYRGLTKDVVTFGYAATLLTTAKPSGRNRLSPRQGDDERVREHQKGSADVRGSGPADIGHFWKAHPVSPGVERAYRELGLIK